MEPNPSIERNATQQENAMSRSDNAQTRSFNRSRTCAAVSCMLMFTLGAGCRFSTNPGDSILVEDASADEAPDSATPPTKTSTGKNATAAAKDAGVEPSDAADAAPSDAGEPAAAAPTTSDAGAAAAAGSSAPTPAAGASAPAAAASSAPVAGSAGATTPPPAAGSLATPTLPVTTPMQSPKEAQCSADLANCLLRDPLAYAECLRTNQDNGCPEPDAGVPVATSPVMTEDGKPLSQACQAELANCIARLPTPENSASCTEKARKCK